MNQTLLPGSASDVPWPTHGRLAGVPDTSMLPEHEKAAAAELEQRIASTETALHSRTERLRRTGDAWAQSLRSGVRRKPLLSLAAAFAFGACCARLTRLAR